MSSLGEAFEGHPVYAHYPNFDFATAPEVPDSHAWQTLDPPAEGEVPVIDLMSPDVVAKLGHACSEWGIFQILNHGLPATFFTDVETESNRLFTLPVEQKLKAARSSDGVTGYGTVRISAFYSKQMWSEGFTIVGSPLEHAQKLWPDGGHSRFCEVIDEYQKEMKKLAVRLMGMVLESLGLREDDRPWYCKSVSDTSHAALQLNYYPACPNPDQAMGMADHTDSPFLTIVHQNSVTGLQVFKNGKYFNVPALPDALVINVGDLLHVLSNGKFKNALHRAVVNKTQPRQSFVYLWGPPANVELSPFSKLVGPDEQPLYRSVTWPEYLKMKAVHFNNALSHLKQLKE